MAISTALKSTFGDSKAVSFKSVGDILSSVGLADAGGVVSKDMLGKDLNTDDNQRKDIFGKMHILDIAHNEFDPQREYMFQVYIQDIPGRYWVDMVNNYPSAIRRLVDLGYGIVGGGITTAAVMGMVNLVRNLGQSGSSSPQQSLVYRTNSVKLPSRSTISKQTNFMGKRNNIVTGTQYEGSLSINFTETEDLFILRQFTSWLNIEDENAILGTTDLSTTRTKAAAKNKLENKLAKILGAGSKLKQRKAAKEQKANNDAKAAEDIAGNNTSAGVNLQKSYMPMAQSMKTDIQLLMYRYNGDDVGYKIKYYGCYPKSIGGASFTYESGSGTISYDIEFDYDHYHIEYIDTPERLNPTNNFRSTLAKLIDSVLNIGVRALFAYIRRNAIADRSDAFFRESRNRPVPRGLPTGTIALDEAIPNFAIGQDEEIIADETKAVPNPSSTAELGEVDINFKTDVNIETIASETKATPNPSPDSSIPEQNYLVRNEDGSFKRDPITGKVLRKLPANFKVGLSDATIAAEHVGQNTHDEMTVEERTAASGEAQDGSNPISEMAQRRGELSTPDFIPASAMKYKAASEHVGQNTHVTVEPNEIAWTEDVDINTVAEEHVGQHDRGRWTYGDYMNATGEAKFTNPASKLQKSDRKTATQSNLSKDDAMNLVANEHKTNQTLHEDYGKDIGKDIVANEHKTNQTLHDRRAQEPQPEGVDIPTITELLSRAKAKMKANKVNSVAEIPSDNAAAPYKISPFERE